MFQETVVQAMRYHNQGRFHPLLAKPCDRHSCRKLLTFRFVEHKRLTISIFVRLTCIWPAWCVAYISSTSDEFGVFEPYKQVVILAAIVFLNALLMVCQPRD